MTKSYACKHTKKGAGRVSLGIGSSRMQQQCFVVSRRFVHRYHEAVGVTSPVAQIKTSLIVGADRKAYLTPRQGLPPKGAIETPLCGVATP